MPGYHAAMMEPRSGLIKVAPSLAIPADSAAVDPSAGVVCPQAVHTMFRLPLSASVTLCCAVAFWGESVKPSVDSIIKRPAKVGGRVVCRAGSSYAHAASAFPLPAPIAS